MSDDHIFLVNYREENNLQSWKPVQFLDGSEAEKPLRDSIHEDGDLFCVVPVSGVSAVPENIQWLGVAYRGGIRETAPIPQTLGQNWVHFFERHDSKIQDLWEHFGMQDLESIVEMFLQFEEDILSVGEEHSVEAFRLIKNWLTIERLEEKTPQQKVGALHALRSKVEILQKLKYEGTNVRRAAVSFASEFCVLILGSYTESRSILGRIREISFLRSQLGGHPEDAQELKDKIMPFMDFHEGMIEKRKTTI